MNPELKRYIDNHIIPCYEFFDLAHRVDHVMMVIEQSMPLAERYDLDKNMVYTIAAYHDTGLSVGREFHHLDSGRILVADQQLQRWFSGEQIALMCEAVEDHRASSDHAPRSIYGCVVAEADRFIDAHTIIRRTVQFGLANHPEFDRVRHWERCREHIESKYGDGGYLKLLIEGSANGERLENLRKIVRNRELFEQLFIEVYEQQVAHLEG